MKLKLITYNCWIAALFFFLFCGCQNDNFYQSYAYQDLWRLPLISPYELITTRGASPNDFHNNWGLKFKKLKDTPPTSSSGVNLTTINVQDSIIYGYGTMHPCYHFIINCKTGEEEVFIDSLMWSLKLKQIGLDPKKLYDVFEVFYAFKDKNILLWDDQVGRGEK